MQAWKFAGNGGRQCWASGWGTGMVLAGAAARACFGFLRDWRLHGGAKALEAHGEVAGDDLMPDPDGVAARAVEIDAPPSAIWPWLVQRGPGPRWRLHLRLDRAPARHGHPQHQPDHSRFQNLKVGDEIPMPGYTMRVERLDPERAMVVRSGNHAWV